MHVAGHALSRSALAAIGSYEAKPALKNPQPREAAARIRPQDIPQKQPGSGLTHTFRWRCCRKSCFGQGANSCQQILTHTHNTHTHTHTRRHRRLWDWIDYLSIFRVKNEVSVAKIESIILSTFSKKHRLNYRFRLLK